MPGARFSGVGDLMCAGLNVSLHGRKASVHVICAVAVLCFTLSACGGGGGGHNPLPGSGGSGSGTGSGGSGGSGGGNGSGPASTLSCDGYPQTLGNFVQVCLMTQQNVAITPNLS